MSEYIDRDDPGQNGNLSVAEAEAQLMIASAALDPYGGFGYGPEALELEFRSTSDRWILAQVQEANRHG